MDCFEDFLELVHPEDRQPFRQAVYDSLSSGQPLESEFRAVRKDGSLRHLYARAMPVRDAAGEFARHAGICQDITERKQAEEALRESEDRYRSLVISCKEAVLLTALDGRIFAANEAACRMFGRSEQELIQGGRDSFVDSSDPRLPLIQAERARTGRVSGEVTFVRKDGTKFPCELSSAVFTNRHGELRASLFVRDITGRKRTQEALRASEERFRNLAEMLPEIVFETDEKGSLVYGNQRAFELAGRTLEELRNGVSPLELVVEKDRERARENIARLLRGEPLHSNEYTFTRPDGATFPGMTRTSPIWRDGRIAGLRGMVIDLTERKRAEEELRRMELLAATGRMAAEIAHEINNPLAGIKNAFTLVKDNISLDHPHYAYVAIVEREIDRVASIVRRMYELHGKKETVAQECEVRRALQDVIALASLGARARGVSIALEAPPEPLHAWVAEESLKEVFFNIIENAVEASPEGAAVRVTLAMAGGNVRISVADSGPGIPPDVAPRIFEPFFTTKNGSTMRGMGLGLPISQRIIKRMGGNIEFETASVRGSIFHIKFPQRASP